MLILGPEICHVDHCPHGCTRATGCQGSEFHLNHADKYVRDRLASIAKEAREWGLLVVYAVEPIAGPSPKAEAK